MLRERFGVSQRRACAVVGIHRSTMRLTPPPVNDEDSRLRAWLRTFSTDRPRWGWRRAAKMARKSGWTVNDKRIRRLWREEGLRVPQRRKKKRLTGIGVTVGAMCPTRPNVIWAMDFQFDTLADGRTIKLLNIIDEYTRECLAIEIGRSIDADQVVRILDRLALARGPRSTCGSTTAPNSSPTPYATGADLPGPEPCSLIRVRRGRTAGSSRSTAACAMNCSTRGASTRSSKPKR